MANGSINLKNRRILRLFLIEANLDIRGCSVWVSFVECTTDSYRRELVYS